MGRERSRKQVDAAGEGLEELLDGPPRERSSDGHLGFWQRNVNDPSRPFDALEVSLEKRRRNIPDYEVIKRADVTYLFSECAIKEYLRAQKADA